MSQRTRQFSLRALLIVVSLSAFIFAALAGAFGITLRRIVGAGVVMLGIEAAVFFAFLIGVVVTMECVLAFYRRL